MSVIDNTARGRFELTEDGHTAFADYEIHGNVMVLPHTVVPPEARGSGMAGRLVKGALDAARERGLKVSPACSYVDAYMRRHPDTQDLRA
jgi:predicted GNAT family acetyltransferase